MLASTDYSACESQHSTAQPSAFTALGFSAGNVTSKNALPPRRSGAPPRLLGDHPAQIAQTSVPVVSNRPISDPLERKRKMRADRRWDNAKMITLSFIVFGLIGGTIQWTRMVGGVEDSQANESRETKVEDSQVEHDIQPVPQVASTNDTAINPGPWREQ